MPPSRSSGLTSLALSLHRHDLDAPLVVLDLASVETYLLVGMLSRTMSDSRQALWCPLQSGPAELDLDRAEAERLARDLDLSVIWPSERWRPVPRAMRVAALAMTRSRTELYMRSMSRMAFGAGFDINNVSAPIEPKQSHLIDPEPYYIAVDEDLGLNGEDVTHAITEGSAYDGALKDLAGELAGLGITHAPAVRFAGELYTGAGVIARMLLEMDAVLLGTARN
jgi:hypothetical protein